MSSRRSGIRTTAGAAVLLLGAVVSGAAGPSAKAPSVRVPQDFATLQAAIDGAPAGARITVARGTYTESVTLTGRTDLTLRGQGRPVLDPGGGTGLTVADCSGITIQGFVFRNASSGIFVDGSSDVAIARCTFDSPAEYGIHGSDSTGIDVDRCKVNDVGTAGVMLGFPEAVDDASVTRCKIERSGRGGVVFGGARNRAERVKVTDADRHGFETRFTVPSADNVFRNLKAFGGDAGVRIHGAGNRIEKVRCSGQEEAGVHLHDDAAGTSVAKVKVTGAVLDGLLFEGTTSDVVKVTVVRPGRHGVHLTGGGHTLTRTKVKQAAADGFHVASESNALDGCQAKKSGGLDLNDASGGTTNDYPASNRFGTRNDGP